MSDELDRAERIVFDALHEVQTECYNSGFAKGQELLIEYLDGLTDNLTGSASYLREYIAEVTIGVKKFSEYCFKQLEITQ